MLEMKFLKENLKIISITFILTIKNSSYFVWSCNLMNETPMNTSLDSQFPVLNIKSLIGNGNVTKRKIYGILPGKRKPSGF